MPKHQMANSTMCTSLQKPASLKKRKRYLLRTRMGDSSLQNKLRKKKFFFVVPFIVTGIESQMCLLPKMLELGKDMCMA